jgi:hypothetical protein
MTDLRETLVRAYPPQVWPKGIEAVWLVAPEGALELVLMDTFYHREFRLRIGTKALVRGGKAGSWVGCLADQINDLLAEALEPPPFYVP